MAKERSLFPYDQGDLLSFGDYPLKILVLGSVYPRHDSDSEVPWMRRSHAELSKEGHEILIIAPSWKGLKNHQIDNCQVIRFPYAPSSWEILTHDEGAPTKLAGKPWMQLLAIPYIIWGAHVFFWNAKRWKPDVLHVHWPFPHGLMALPAKWILKIPLILNFHGAELLLARKKPWVKPFLRFVLGHANAVLANSSFTASRIQEIRNVKVALSPYGTTLSQESVHQISKQAQMPAHVLFVGRHIPRKGIDVLLHAAKHLPTDKYQIRIVGQGSESPHLQALAQHLELSNVIFTGKLSSQDLDQEYRQAQVFVLPAIVDDRGDTEGLGVVLIEAIELGLPIVASQVGGIPDVIIHEKTGLLVPEKDPQALANAIQQIVENPHLALELNQGAQAHVKTHFSWEVVTQGLEKIYRQIVRS